MADDERDLDAEARTVAEALGLARWGVTLRRDGPVADLFDDDAGEATGGIALDSQVWRALHAACAELLALRRDAADPRFREAKRRIAEYEADLRRLHESARFAEAPSADRLADDRRCASNGCPGGHSAYDPCRVASPGRPRYTMRPGATDRPPSSARVAPAVVGVDLARGPDRTVVAPVPPAPVETTAGSGAPHPVPEAASLLASPPAPAWVTDDPNDPARRRDREPRVLPAGEGDASREWRPDRGGRGLT